MMLIGRSEPRILLPVPKWDWREPSIALPKDQFGRQDRTRFKLELWHRDGRLVDLQWLDDRDEFDAALYRVLIEEPHADLVPMWATVVTLTGTAGSNQVYNVPLDWDSANNTVECIGGGASGGAARQATRRVGTGGGSGGYGLDNDHVLTPGGTATYQLGAGGVGVTTPGTTTTINGNDGGDTWFDGTTYAGASVGALGGQNGVGSTTDANGGAGGGGKGDASFTGGRGGNATAGAAGNNRQATGGGGAAGRNGNGGNGADTTGTSNFAGDGGTGDNGTGGAGGSGADNPGSNGTEMDGIGAGGGSSAAISGTTEAAGNYGAGTGGVAVADAGSNGGSATAAQGAIVLTFTPLVAASGNFFMLMN
jgi:hypothetical protein